MTDPSPYQVPMSELLAVKVPAEEQVEEQDPTPPNPDAKKPFARQLESAGGPIGAVNTD